MGMDSFKDSLASLHQGKINVDVDVYEQAQYHTSWNWLMPVVEKIGELYHTITIETNNESDQCVILCYKEDEKYRRIFEVGLTLHEATYKAVVEFIKEYNK